VLPAIDQSLASSQSCEGLLDLHDLAMLELTVSASSHFPTLLAETLAAESGGVASLPPAERLSTMLAILDADEHYEAEYSRFVEGTAIVGDAEIPNFRAATEAVRRLSALLPASP